VALHAWVAGYGVPFVLHFGLSIWRRCCCIIRFWLWQLAFIGLLIRRSRIKTHVLEAGRFEP